MKNIIKAIKEKLEELFWKFSHRTTMKLSVGIPVIIMVASAIIGKGIFRDGSGFYLIMILGAIIAMVVVWIIVSTSCCVDRDEIEKRILAKKQPKKNLQKNKDVKQIRADEYDGE